MGYQSMRVNSRWNRYSKGWRHEYTGVQI